MNSMSDQSQPWEGGRISLPFSRTMHTPAPLGALCSDAVNSGELSDSFQGALDAGQGTGERGSEKAVRSHIRAQISGHLP